MSPQHDLFEFLLFLLTAASAPEGAVGLTGFRFAPDTAVIDRAAAIARLSRLAIPCKCHVAREERLAVVHCRAIDSVEADAWAADADYLLNPLRESFASREPPAGPNPSIMFLSGDASRIIDFETFRYLIQNYGVWVPGSSVDSGATVDRAVSEGVASLVFEISP